MSQLYSSAVTIENISASLRLVKELKNNLCHRLSHEGHRSSSQSFADRWHQCIFYWSHEIKIAHPQHFHHCSSAFVPSACNKKQYICSSFVAEAREVPAIPALETILDKEYILTILVLRPKFWAYSVPCCLVAYKHAFITHKCLQIFNNKNVLFRSLPMGRRGGTLALFFSKHRSSC